MDALLLLAEADAAVDGVPIGHWISNLSATGVLAWVVWYTLSRAIPDIIAKYTTETTAARTAFLGELSDTRKTFREEIAAERDHCAAELAKAYDRAKLMIDAAGGQHGQA